MSTFGTMRQTLTTLAKRIAGPRRESGFVCSECERWRRCGLPPSNNCFVMLEQIAREGRASRHESMIRFDAALI